MFPYIVPRLHDRLDLHDLTLRELLKDRPVLVRRAVGILAVFSALVTLVFVLSQIDIVGRSGRGRGGGGPRKVQRSKKG